MVMPSSPLGNQVSKSITLKNTGKKNALIVQNVTTDNPEFNHGASTCPAGGVAPGLTCTITLTFNPTGLGLRTANLTISDNANTGTQIVALTGTGQVTTAVTPGFVSIGSVKFGSKMVKTVTVSNKQNQTVSLAAGFAGGNATDFAVTGGTCGGLLSAKAICTMAVTFTPGALGVESTTMSVTPSPDPLAPYSVAFSALSTIPETVTTRLSYGNVAEGASKTLNATVTNNANAPITLGAGVSGPNAADFALTGGTCGATLAGLSSCTYAVTFTPATEAAETASLSIAVAEDPTSPRIVGLAGAGISPLRATPLTGVLYGTVLNGKSLSRNVNVMNASAATLSISESITGPNSADFAVVAGGTCGATLAGGASCFYKVAFTPSIIGAESATIGVSAVGDAASPHNVSLSGTGG
jgi:hypothetical protein